jgi:hypothetical protein
MARSRTMLGIPVYEVALMTPVEKHLAAWQYGPEWPRINRGQELIRQRCKSLSVTVSWTKALRQDWFSKTVQRRSCTVWSHRPRLRSICEWPSAARALTIETPDQRRKC